MLPPAVPDFVPVQVPPKVASASVMPLGSESTSAALNVAAVALLLVNVIVNTLVPPGAIVVGLNAFATVGAVVTVKVAVAAVALLPLFVCKAPAAMVFGAAPGVLLVTFAVIVHVPGVPPGIVPPEA